MMRRGFTLVELAIVLVIIGLLVGGVMAGQTLIHASELRAISTEADRFMTARNAFRDKYFKFPGDFANAYAFWGAACGTNTTVLTTGCNGNANGIVEAANVGENLKAWEHLSRSGLVEGNYTASSANDGTYMYVDPTGVPASKFSQGYWEITDQTGNAMVNASVNAVLTFGTAVTGNNNSLLVHPSLTHLDAWNVDKKMDDGFANTGKVRGDGSDLCFDASTTDPYGLQAAGNNYTGDCLLYFLL